MQWDTVCHFAKVDSEAPQTRKICKKKIKLINKQRNTIRYHVSPPRLAKIEKKKWLTWCAKEGRKGRENTPVHTLCWSDIKREKQQNAGGK